MNDLRTDSVSVMPLSLPALALVLGLAVSLSACGFKPRGVTALPADLGAVAVVSPDRYSPLADTLARGLERAGAEQATRGQAGTSRLEVLSERWADIPISVDAFGRAQEYSLRYAVVFRLVRADGKLLVPQQAVELARDYVAPASDAIGNNSERELLVGEMRREMAAAILRRVDAAAQGAATPVPPPQAP